MFYQVTLGQTYWAFDCNAGATAYYLTLEEAIQAYTVFVKVSR